MLIDICKIVWGSYSGAPADKTKLIRELIEKKAKELVEHPRVLGKEEIYHILGLSSEPESFPTQMGKGAAKNYEGFKEKPEKKVWCEHIEMRRKLNPATDEWYDDKWTLSYDVVSDSWAVCPICATPRPVEKSLEEKLVDRFEELSTHILHYHDKEGRTTPEQVIHKARFIEMAQVALEVIRKEWV